MKEPFIDYGGGGIPSNGLDALTAEEMRDWLRSVLFVSGHSYRSGIVDVGTPLDWACLAFRSYNPSSRACFVDALLLLLQEVPQNNAWEIAQQEGVKSPFVQLSSKLSAAGVLKAMTVEEKARVQQGMLTLLESPDLEAFTKIHALSILSEVGFELRGDYVRGLYEVSSKQDPIFALHVFSHLAKTDLSDAFQFLAAQPDMIIGADFMVQYLPFRLVNAADTEAVNAGLDLLRDTHPKSRVALDGVEQNYLDKLSKIKR